MNEQAIRFRLGIFVLAALILLAVLITLFGGFPSYFKKTDSYTIVFTNAQGVAPGTPVRRSGVKVGDVRGLALDNKTGKVHVAIQIESGFSLRKADKPTLVRGLLGGDTSIDFLPPDPDQKEVDPGLVEVGATLDGVSPSDASALVQKAGDVMGPTQEAMVEIKKVFQKLDKMAPALDDTLQATKQLVPELRKTNDEIRNLVKSTDLKRTNEEVQLVARQWSKVGERLDVLLQSNEDKITKAVARLDDTLKKVGDLFSDENQKMVRDTLKNVKNSSERLDGITKGTEEMIREIQLTLKRTNDSLLKADDVLTNMQKTTKPFADRSPAILKNIEESTEKLNQTLTDLREIYQTYARSDGTIQKLLTDPALYNNLNDSAAMVTKIMPRLDRILRDVEIFADKIARHPESLGVGGVIRPGSGLKESPSILPWRH